MAWLASRLTASGLLAAASLLEFLLWLVGFLTSPSRVVHGALFSADLVNASVQLVLNIMAPSILATRLARVTYAAFAWVVPWLFHQWWFIRPVVALDDAVRVVIDRAVGPIIIQWMIFETRSFRSERLRDSALLHGSPLDLPQEVLAVIIERLDPTSRRALRLSSRQMYSAVNQQVTSCTVTEANMCLAISVPLPRVFPNLETLIISLDPGTFVTLYKDVYGMCERALGRVSRSFTEKVTAGVVSLDHNIFLHHLFLTVLPALPKLRLIDLSGVASLFPRSWHTFVGACPLGSCTVRLNPRGLPQPPLPAIVAHGLRSLCPQHLTDLALLVQSRPAVRIEAVKDGFVHSGLQHWVALATLPQLHSAVATLRSADCDALLGDERTAAQLLPRLSVFTHLRMPSITVPAPQLAALAAAPRLRTLELGVINDPAQYSALALLPLLRDLTAGLLFVPQGAHPLVGITRLTVTRMTCTDPLIGTVFPTLKAVVTAGPGFAVQRWGGDQRGQPFHGLAGHVGIQELTLSCGSDLWVEASRLSTLVGLRTLSLWGPYKAAALKHLLQVAEQLPRLDRLELHSLQGVLWGTGSEAKQEPLLAHPRLARRVGQHLQGMRSLRSLLLDDCCGFELLRRLAAPPSGPLLLAGFREVQLRAASHRRLMGGLQELHLANMPDLHEGDVIFAARALSRLQRLVVSGCRGIELADVLQLPGLVARRQLDVQWSHT